MEKTTREKLIELLIRNYTETIKQELANEEEDFLFSLLKFGTPGFEELSNQELIQEYRDIYNLDIEIIREEE